MYKFEQKGESLHHSLNILEDQFKNIIDKPNTFFLMIREYEIRNSTANICEPTFNK
jgi:hypothetical protein